MILIVGLGNPGGRYERTRHNVGFLVVDRLLGSSASPSWQTRFQGLFALTTWAGQRVGLLKPQTFMNLSGRSVQPAAAFYKLPSEQIVVVHDELDLPFGDLRLKIGGGDAGHKGLVSITSALGTPNYVRLRCGIGRPPPDYGGSMADFVLEAFSFAEREVLESGLERAAEAVTLVVRDGLAAAMNVTNRRTPPSLLREHEPGATVHKENS